MCCLSVSIESFFVLSIKFNLLCVAQQTYMCCLSVSIESFFVLSIKFKFLLVAQQSYMCCSYRHYLCTLSSVSTESICAL